MADATADTRVFSEGYHFLVRRLHSLSGLVPIGTFLCVHLSINASILAGPDAFQFAVDKIHQLDRLGVLKVVELAFIFVPIAFHALVGVVIWLTSRPNLSTYRYWDNARYTLQRWTGVFALVFIVWHLWHMHWLGGPFGNGGQFRPHEAAASAVEAMNRWWWWGPVYALGVLCAVFHFANGVWTLLITWGVTTGPKSQRLSGGVCILIGLMLFALGMGGLVKLRTMALPSADTPPGGVHTSVTIQDPDLSV